MMLPPSTLSDEEFRLLRQLFHNEIGLHLSSSKKSLVSGRLIKRLGALGLASFKDYYELLMAPEQEEERQQAIDLITTNETYFFREHKHFDFLRQQILPTIDHSHTLRIWSAASSTGEEAYSVAMLLEATRAHLPWAVFASDISSRVLTAARRGLYPMARGEKIPKDYLKRFCLKGVGQYEGRFLVQEELRKKVAFRQLNLMGLPSSLGVFDVVFLRNVIIYFDLPTKARVVRGVAEHLRPGGWLFVGHSESLHGMDSGLELVVPSIYRKRDT